MNPDLITYGNPTQEHLAYLNQEGLFDDLFSEVVKYKFPKNSSEDTKKELNNIVDNINIVQNQKHFVHRYKAYDKNLKRSVFEFILKGREYAEEAMEMVESIYEDTNSLILKLKYHHQRPRPYQLAKFYKLKLFPYESYSSQSPSFPSGHAFQIRLITEVLGNNFPEIYGVLQKMMFDVCYSRIYLGLHYESDVDVGLFVADRLLENKTFIQKYRL